MQVQTNCKINVSPASGRDVEREIGLVGPRNAIEAAKRAIMEKVHAVVSLLYHLWRVSTKRLPRRRRTVQTVEVEAVAAMVISAMTAIQITNSSNNCTGNSPMPKLKLNLMLKVLLVVKTPMRPMVATRTTWLSGWPTGHSKANNLEDSHRRVGKVLLARESAPTLDNPT